MKKLILIVLWFVALGAFAQTSPTLPVGSMVYGNTYFLDLDGNVWAGSAAKQYRVVAQKSYVDSINTLGWSNAQIDSAISVNISFLNVKTFGAVGDGVTDDTEAIRDAMDYLKTSGDGRLFFPEGVYMISGTVYIPSDVEIFGDGAEKSIVRNLTTASLDLIIPYGDFGNTQDENVYKYRTMWASETADKSVLDSVKNITIHDMGFDWNGLDCGLYSAVEVLIGSAVNCNLYNIHFFPVLPADLDNTLNRWRGRCLLFAFAQDCSVSKSVINAADYESVSAWYLSKSIRIYNNLFDIDKPSTFVAQNHAVQAATPPLIAPDLITQYGEFKAGPVYIYDNTFLMRGNVNHAITSHTGKGIYITNNFVKAFPEAKSVFGFKPFEGTEDFIITGNTLDYLDATNPTEGITAISLNSTREDHLPVRNGIITNNMVKIKQDLVSAKPAIGGDYVPSENINISNNTIEIHDYIDSPNKGISASGTDINITGNQIKYMDPVGTITSSGPVGVFTKPATDLIISDNIISGDAIATGVLTQAGSSGSIHGNIYNNAISGISQTGMAVDWVNTTTAQTDIGGKKKWTSGQIWAPTDYTSSPPVTNNSVEVVRVGSTQTMLRGGNNTGAVSFMLRSYSANGVQMSLNDGGIEAQSYRLSTLNTAPASATAAGTVGEIRITATYIYVCTATNTWVRAALTTW